MKVLCIGDSLTYGNTLHSLPTGDSYTDYLTDLLPQHTFVNSGVCGETTGQIAYRLHNIMNSEKFDLVIILAGTNDLGLKLGFKKITSNLLFMYDIVHKYGAKLITCTVPESAYADNVKSKVNDWVRSYLKCYAMYDLNKSIPFSHDHFSIDNLHFNDEGYRLMAKQLVNILA